MLTAFQKRKLTTLFHVSDLNHDGYLEKADYQEFANRVCQALDLPPDSPEYHLVQTQTTAVWNDDYLKAFDTDGDNRVSLDEHVAAYAVTLGNKEMFQKYLLDYTRFVAELWDRDGDGQLSRNEYDKLLWCYGVEGAAAHESFRHLDRNGDSFLSEDELLLSVEEFFLSDDPDAPGNWLVGPY